MPHTMEGALADMGMLSGQTLLMDGTYQSRTGPLVRKHPDKCSPGLMYECMNMQEAAAAVCQCI